MARYKVIPLGTSGWIPTQERETMCFAVEARGALLLFDAGTGVKRFLAGEAKSLLQRHDRVYLFLSHFHLEHVFGITFMPLFLKDKNLKIFGPSKSITGHTTQEVLTNLFQSPVFALPILDFPMNLEIADLKEGNNIIDDFRIDVIPQQHSDTSIGIRLDNKISYVTDTVCSAQTVEFAKDSDLLVHECYFDNRDFQALNTSVKGRLTLASHSYAPGVAEIAQKAGVKLLALSHLNPEYSEHRLARMLSETRHIFNNTIIPKDMEAFEV